MPPRHMKQQSKSIIVSYFQSLYTPFPVIRPGIDIVGTPTHYVIHINVLGMLLVYYMLCILYYAIYYLYMQTKGNCNKAESAV